MLYEFVSMQMTLYKTMMSIRIMMLMMSLDFLIIITTQATYLNKKYKTQSIRK